MNVQCMHITVVEVIITHFDTVLAMPTGCAGTQQAKVWHAPGGTTCAGCSMCIEAGSKGSSRQQRHRGKGMCRSG